MTTTALMGLGRYAPSKVVTNDDLAQLFDTSDEWIQQRTRIQEQCYIGESGTGVLFPAFGSGFTWGAGLARL